MLHKQVDATVTETDQGVFEAIAACYTVDRQGDQIIPGAFTKSLKRWRASGRRIPIHWNHSGEAKDIIGSINPSAARETSDGLYVEGQLHLTDSEVAKEAWRAMKDNSVALSFGFMVTDEHERADGVRELREIDLFEISVVAHPANADTRLLSLKAASSPVGVDLALPSDAEIRERVKRRREAEQKAQQLEAERKAARPIRVRRFEC